MSNTSLPINTQRLHKAWSKHWYPGALEWGDHWHSFMNILERCPLNFNVYVNHISILLKYRFWYSWSGMGLDTEPQCRFMDNTLSSKALGHFGWTCETEDPTALYEIVLMTMTSNLILVSIFFLGGGHVECRSPGPRTKNWGCGIRGQ